VQTYLDFEKPLAEIEQRIIELRALAHESEDGTEQGISKDIKSLEDKAKNTLTELYESLTPWQRTQVSRHPDRPHFQHYVGQLMEEFTSLAGDRKFGEDLAIMGGLARFRNMPVVVMGHEKGTDTQSRIDHNFGMANPEGYRKAVRLMEIAERFSLPVLTFVDTAGAYPGIGAEERGQAEAIARATDACLGLGVPNISVIVGEGGSGGAVAIATANKVLMLENSIYTVASPEASASILWRDASRAKDAANNMKITAQDLKAFGIIDEIIEEPTGGAHRNPMEMVIRTGNAIEDALREFEGLSPKEVRAARAAKYLAMTRVLGS